MRPSDKLPLASTASGISSSSLLPPFLACLLKGVVDGLSTEDCQLLLWPRFEYCHTVLGRLKDLRWPGMPPTQDAYKHEGEDKCSIWAFSTFSALLCFTLDPARCIMHSYRGGRRGVLVIKPVQPSSTSPQLGINSASIAAYLADHPASTSTVSPKRGLGSFLPRHCSLFWTAPELTKLSTLAQDAS